MPCKILSFSLTPNEILLIESIKKEKDLRSQSAVIGFALKNCHSPVSQPASMEQKIQVPDLPGMSERIVRSQLIRFDLSMAEYNTIVNTLIDVTARKGEKIRNPEAAIFGACRRWVRENRRSEADDISDYKTASPAKTYTELQDQIYG